MTINPILDLTSNEIKDYVYVKTNLGGWFFDAFLKMNHTTQLSITQHPVQSGASISDYAYQEPKQLTMDIGMTDVAKSFIPDQFAGSGSRSVKAYQIMQQLQDLRVPIQVMTRLGLYENMLIKSLTSPDDNTTYHGLKCTVTLQQIIVAQIKTVKISANPAVTGSSKKGHQEPNQVPSWLNSSILYKLFGNIG